MKHKINKLFLLGMFSFLTISVASVAFLQSINVKQAEATETTYDPACTLYEFDEDSDFVISEGTKVTSLPTRESAMGWLRISGDITQKGTFRGKEAYGVLGNIYFSYEYQGTHQSEDVDKWNLRPETGTVVNDETLTGSINKGAFLLYKSYDGQVWEHAVNPIVNYFEDNKSGSENFYKTDGEDTGRGTYYKLVIAYTLGKKSGVGYTPFWPFGKHDVFEEKKYLEYYEFYVANDSVDFSLHNLSVTHSELESEEYSVETLARGETLQNNDTTLEGFQIDTLGATFLVGVSRNDGDIKYYPDGQKFTDEGYYSVTVTSKLGTKNSRNIYIFKGGEDRGYSTYFGPSHITGQRVFRYDDYPTYTLGATFHVNALSKYVPSLTGTITNLTTGNITTLDGSNRAAYEYPLEVGTYSVVLYSGQTESGSFYQYSFTFKITEDPSIPYINYDNLSKTNRFCDLSSKHYEVAYQTTKGGYVFVCFSIDSYTNAFNYAYEIEKRYIEKTDGGFYYKSKDNPNVKVKYYDNFEITAALSQYAKQNIEISYFNALDEFTFRTYDDDLLENLESINITESIKVFPNEKEREKTTSRLPYINNFTFISSVNYDSTSVKVTNAQNNDVYVIKYGKDVSEQLDTSALYKITETNVYGNTREYEAYFVNENQTSIPLSCTLGDAVTNRIVSASDTKSSLVSVNADIVTFGEAVSAFDDDTIVVISAPTIYTFDIKCLASELNNLTLYKPGAYTVSVIDRIGNTFSFTINISGSKKYGDVFSSDKDNISYTDVYNNVHINKRELLEEVIFVKTDLKNSIDRTVVPSSYTTSSYANYYHYLDAAQTIYDKVSATQGEINKATQELNKAYEDLVLVRDKDELLDLLKSYLLVDKEKYTSDSYAALTAAYEAGLIVLANDSATPDQITNAYQTYSNIYNGLLLKGDKDTLKEKLDLAKKVDCSLYTPKTVSNLNYIYSKANEVYLNENALQEDVNLAITDLNSGLEGLEEHADFNELNKLIRYCLMLDNKEYTKASWDQFKEKYDSALAVYKDYDTEQEIVDKVTYALSNSSLFLNKSGDATELKKTVDTIRQLDAGLYTNDTIISLKTKYDDAIKAIEERDVQERIDSLNESLKVLSNLLVVNEYKEKLRDVLSSAEKIDQSKLEINEKLMLKNAYENALKVYNSTTSSDETIEKSMNELKEAVDKVDGGSSLTWWQITLIVVGAILVLLIVLALFGVL